MFVYLYPKHIKMEKVKKKITKENIVDSETGELISIRKEETTFIVGDPGEFTRIYSAVEGLINDLTPATYKLWGHLVINTPGRSNIFLTGNEIEKIANTLKLGVSTIKNGIMELTRKNLLIREFSSKELEAIEAAKREGVKPPIFRTSSYILNPRYSSGTSEEKRRERLLYVLTVICPEA